MKVRTILLSIFTMAAVAAMLTGFVPEAYSYESGSPAVGSLDRSSDLAMGGGRQRGEDTTRGTDSGTTGEAGTGTTGETGTDATRGEREKDTGTGTMDSGDSTRGGESERDTRNGGATRGSDMQGTYPRTDPETGATQLGGGGGGDGGGGGGGS